jgi:membrane protein DedA with SNARE-associated domain
MFPITAFYIYLGKQFGPQWKDVGVKAEEYMLPVAGIIITAILLFIVVKKVRKKITV